MPCFVYNVIRDLESIDHLFINPIRRIGFYTSYLLIGVSSSGVCKLMFCLTIVNKTGHSYHFWLAGQKWCIFGLLKWICPLYESVDPDQLASKPADLDLQFPKEGKEF